MSNAAIAAACACIAANNASILLMDSARATNATEDTNNQITTCDHQKGGDRIMSQKEFDFRSIITADEVDRDWLKEQMRLAALAVAKGYIDDEAWGDLVENYYLDRGDTTADVDGFINDFAGVDVQFSFEAKSGPLARQTLSPDEYYEAKMAKTHDLGNHVAVVKVFYAGKGRLRHLFGDGETLNEYEADTFQTCYGMLWEEFYSFLYDVDDPEEPDTLEEDVLAEDETIDNIPTGDDIEDDSTEETVIEDEFMDDDLEGGTEGESNGNGSDTEEAIFEVEENPDTGNPNTGNPDTGNSGASNSGTDTAANDTAEPVSAEEAARRAAEEELQADREAWLAKDPTIFTLSMRALDMTREGFNPRILQGDFFDGGAFCLGSAVDSPYFCMAWDHATLEEHSIAEIEAYAKKAKLVFYYAGQLIYGHCQECIEMIRAEEAAAQAAEAVAEAAKLIAGTPGAEQSETTEGTSQSDTTGAPQSGATHPDSEAQAQIVDASEITSRMPRYSVAQWQTRIDEMLTDEQREQLDALGYTVDSMFVGIKKDVNVAQIVHIFEGVVGMEAPAEIQTQMDRTIDTINEQILAEQTATAADTLDHNTSAS